MTLAHFSDIHLGYEAYAARSPSGRNQRGEDVVRALHQVVSDIVAADPPLVICSGDVAELPQLPVRYMLAAAAEFSRLAGVRPDGTRRQLVVIAGNHDQSKHSRDGCFLDLYRNLPGVHVVSAGYQPVRFDPADPLGAPDPGLADLVVHALAHDALRDLAELHVVPVPDACNVLTAHGVAESSELYRRAIGREYVIPAELLLGEWDYVALGHWHTQGPVFPLGVAGGDRSKIWYAGSLESIDFADVRGGAVTERGWLLVDVAPGAEPTVTRRRHPVRPMVNLPDVDAAGRSPDEILAALVANLAEPHDEAVLRQRVRDVSRDIWTLVDTAAAQQAARRALFYRLEPVFFADTPDADAPRGLPRLGTLVSEYLAAHVPAADRDAVGALVRSLLEQVAVEMPDDETPDETPDDETPADVVAPGSPDGADPTDAARDADAAGDVDAVDAAGDVDAVAARAAVLAEFPELVVGAPAGEAAR